MKIRFATMEDAEALAKNNVMLAKESEGIRINFEKTLEGVKKVIEDEQRGFYMVAEEGDRIVGQLMVTYEWSDWRAKQIWWLQSIYVDEKWRRKGVMKMMVKEIMRMAEKNNVVLLRLYVHEKNEKAIAAYEKTGMKRAPYLIYEFEMKKDTITSIS